jgi:hypothetical protein
MYEQVSCDACMQEYLDHPEDPPELQKLRATQYPANTTTDIGFLLRCPRGHVSWKVSQEPTFARLFERALRQLGADQARDAVLDAHTALEMYLRHVPARARYNADPTACPLALRDELTEALRFGDRAVGAALATYALVAKSKPPAFPNAEVRNLAVHQGKYPSLPAAEKHCLAVESFVMECERVLGAPANGQRSYWLALYLAEIEELRKRPEFKGLEPQVFAGGYALSVAGPAEPGAKERIAHYRSLAKGEPPPSMTWSTCFVGVVGPSGGLTHT